MDLLFVRHAEPERIEGGSGVPADPALTVRGRDQAQRLADWLAHEHVDVVVSSTKKRAIETAQPIAAAHGLDLVLNEQLIEWDTRADHYIPTDELKATNDPRWRAMIEERWEDYGGEATDVFRLRIADALDGLIADHPGQRVVAVCHGGAINVALALVLGMNRALWFDPMYTSMSRVVASRTGVRMVVSVNERAHLEARREPA